MGSITIPGTDNAISQEEYANIYGINGADGLVHEQETAIIKKNVVETAAADLATDLLEGFGDMSEGEKEML